MTKYWALSIALLVPVAMFAQHKDSDKLSPELRCQQTSQGPVHVIVQFNHSLNAGHQQKIRTKGGVVNAELGIVKGVAATLPASALEMLARDTEVAYISPDRPLKSTSIDVAAPSVYAPYLWNLGYDGTGVGVAILDSGVHLLDDLKDAAGRSRVVYQQDFTGGNSDDAYGHGTHVAGIIAGNGKYSTCSSCKIVIRGVAPAVTLINFRVLDKNGAGTDSAVISAINQAVALKSKYNIRIINLSLGRPIYESYTLDPLCQAVEKAWQAGIVVVVAAGNDGRDNSRGTDGYGTINAPANDPMVITVGAMNTHGTPDRSDDTVTSYSSKGPSAIDHIVKPDIVAPGNQIVSLEQGYLKSAYPNNRAPNSFYQNTTSTSVSDKYFVLSGTSMATGAVSGVVADLLEAHPALTPDQVKASLMKTASKGFPAFSTVVDNGFAYTSEYDVFTIGAGYIDAQAALNESSLATLAATSPTAYFDSTSANVYFLYDRNALWGSNALGVRPLYGGQMPLSALPISPEAMLCGAAMHSGEAMPYGEAPRLMGSTRCGAAMHCGDQAAHKLNRSPLISMERINRVQRESLLRPCAASL